MPTPQEVRDTVETWLQPRLAAIHSRQQAFFAANGRYFQGILTPSNTADDGAEIVPDDTKRPTDQVERWSDFGLSLPAAIPAQLALDIYEGQRGSGYMVRVQVNLGGNIWARTIDRGPENGSHGWIRVEPE